MDSRTLEIVIVVGGLIMGGSLHAEERAAQTKVDKEKPFVYTNADLPAAGESSSASPATVGDVSPLDSLPAIPPIAEYRDKDAHGEGWWRQRAAEFDLRVLDAMITAEQLHVDFIKGKDLVDPTLPARSQAATQIMVALEAERERLPEMLRQAGGLPGWLRRGDFSVPTEWVPSPVPKAPTHAEFLNLSWRAAQGAAFYIVEVQGSDGCGLMDDCEVRSLDVSETSAQFAFEPGRSGRWRVRALDATGIAGDWSAWSGFEHVPLIRSPEFPGRLKCIPGP